MSSSSMNLKKNSSDMPSKGENKTIFLILSTNIPKEFFFFLNKLKGNSKSKENTHLHILWG